MQHIFQESACVGHTQGSGKSFSILFFAARRLCPGSSHGLVGNERPTILLFEGKGAFDCQDARKCFDKTFPEGLSQPVCRERHTHLLGIWHPGTSPLQHGFSNRSRKQPLKDGQRFFLEAYGGFAKEPARPLDAEPPAELFTSRTGSSR